MVTDPSSASAAEIAHAVAAGEISATAVTEAALAASDVGEALGAKADSVEAES